MNWTSSRLGGIHSVLGEWHGHLHSPFLPTYSWYFFASNTAAYSSGWNPWCAHQTVCIEANGLLVARLSSSPQSHGCVSHNVHLFHRIPPDNGHPGAPGGIVRTMPQSSIPYDVCDGCIPKTLECGAEEAPRHKREQDSILTANYGGVSTGLLPRTPAADASRSARLWSEASSNFNLKSEAKVAASCSSCPFLDFPCPPNAADCFAEHE
jgi:hypothetical protein